MGKKTIAHLLVVLALIGVAGGYVETGVQAYARYQQQSLAKQKHCGDQSAVHICVTSPSTIFSAFYPYYVATHDPLFVVEHSSPGTIFVSVSIVDFTLVQTRTLAPASTVASDSFVPDLLQKGQVLSGLTRDVSTAVHVQVSDANRRVYYDNDIPLLLRSRWVMLWNNDTIQQIAAWVTPRDRVVTDLVSRSIMQLPQQKPPLPGGLFGYNVVSPQQVVDQVDAIYDTLRFEHMKYVQESVPFDGSSTTSGATENIKLPFEVLKQDSGMCIELTVLLASAVESIGLHSQIVIVPGHAFLGVAVTKDNTRFEYWDAVYLNNNVAADSANVYTDSVYVKQQHSVIGAILVSDARDASIRPML
jgi:hypothetical protein